MRKFTVLLLGTAALLAVGCRTNESPEGQVDDVQITAQVKSKLAADVGLSTVTNISVNSTNGIVTLAGQVDSAEIRAKAESAARSVPKVVRVIDNLQVAPSTGRRPDARSGSLSRTALAG
jgi:hyperosmotically inducible protein